MNGDLDSTIRNAAITPARVSADGTSAEARDLRELIEADRYLAERSAARTGTTGLRWFQLVPPGGGP